MTTSITSNPSAASAIIVGGGIGGLHVALWLINHGWHVRVFEQAAQISDVGAGVQLSPNSTQVLDRLGVLGAITPLAYAPEHAELRSGKSGEVITSFALGTRAEMRWGAPYLHMYRPDLINVLFNELQRQQYDALILGATAIAYEQTDTDATLHYMDVHGTKQTADADLLIGADGIHSTIRQQMHANAPARFTGHVAWRGIANISDLGDQVIPPTACVWTGSGRHAVTYRLQGGKLANFVGVVEQRDWQIESWTERGSTEHALADFAKWHPHITELIKATGTMYRWALFDRPALPHWHDGRVVLLGDACHAMLPFLAQGAAMSIEDGYALTTALFEEESVAVALQQYSERRIPRTTKVAATSKANSHIYHRRNALTQALTYMPMRIAQKVLPEFVASRFDWLYGYDELNQQNKK